MICTDIKQLQNVCENVESIDEGREIISKLDSELKNSPQSGIGLAANQIGINKKVCIVRIPGTDLSAYNIDLVNPEIVFRRLPFIMKNEGCLSFPDEIVSTMRYGIVGVKDLTSYPQVRIFNKLAAVVIQHEVDHLNGITMYDRQVSKLNPNDICPCLSGKDLKHCCALTMRTNKVI